ncbi:unnamed protein product [Closterium sp. NIES-54]
MASFPPPVHSVVLGVWGAEHGGGGCGGGGYGFLPLSPTAAAVAEGGGCVGAKGFGFKRVAVGVELGFEQGSVALASVASEPAALVASGSVAPAARL